MFAFLRPFLRQRRRLLPGLFLALTVLLAARPIAAADGAQRFVVSVDNIGRFAFGASGVFNTPDGAAAPGPLLPGESYSWTFHAAEGDRLSFATMFVQSNDWFLAPDELGIPLYANGRPANGDYTSYVKLWDAGTEGDQPPGSGTDQAPRQAGPNTGAAQGGVVSRVTAPGFTNPAAFVHVTVTPLD